MAHIKGEVLIRRPVEEVFDFVVDECNEPKYNPAMTSSTMTTPGPIGIGTRFAAVHRSRRGPLNMTVEITDYQRPHRLASTTTMPGSNVHGMLTFEQAATGTRMRWDWDVHVEALPKIAAPLVKVIGSHQERVCWEALKRYLENGSDIH